MKKTLLAALFAEIPALEGFQRLGHSLDHIPRPVDDESLVDDGVYPGNPRHRGTGDK